MFGPNVSGLNLDSGATTTIAAPNSADGNRAHAWRGPLASASGGLLALAPTVSIEPLCWVYDAERRRHWEFRGRACLGISFDVRRFPVTEPFPTGSGRAWRLSVTPADGVIVGTLATSAYGGGFW
jgi:hypothetical protein